MRFLRQTIPFLFVVCLLVSACTKAKNKPPMDSELIQGKHEKAYYHTRSPQSASILLTEGPGKPGRRFEFENNTLSKSSAIEAELIHFSSDERVVTIQGLGEIFEFSTITIALLTQGTPPPKAKIESICNGISSAGYEEFHIEAGIETYIFSALAQGKKDTIGGNGVITKDETHTFVTYLKQGFGNLKIDKSHPDTSDSHYFKASFSVGTPTPWDTVGSMYCHLNTVPVTPDPQPPFAEHTLFTTLQIFKGNFGGLATADAICESSASFGTVTASKPGRWRAILSAEVPLVHAFNHIHVIPSVPIKNANGDTLLPDTSELWEAVSRGALPHFNEFGNMMFTNPIKAWTGSGVGGLVSPAATCNSWTSNNSSDFGAAGLIGALNIDWLANSLLDCSQDAHLYCINSNE